MERINKLSVNDILNYEVHSNWLAPYIFFGWGQYLLGWYIGKKVNRKYKRYLRSMDFRARILTYDTITNFK